MAGEARQSQFNPAARNLFCLWDAPKACLDGMQRLAWSGQKVVGHEFTPNEMLVVGYYQGIGMGVRSSGLQMIYED